MSGVLRLLLLVVLFVAVPIVELYLILTVGGKIGAVPTVVILLLDSLLGSLLLRSQGRTVWRRFQTAVARGQVPTREILDGVCVVLGGAFLVTPGFLTDVLGLLLLIPPSRAVIRRLATRALGRRVAVSVAGAAQGRPQRAPNPWDVEGTASEVDDGASPGWGPNGTRFDR